MIKKENRKKEFPSVHEIEMSGNLGFISIVGQHLNVRIDIAVGNHYFVPFRERDGYKGRVRRRQLYSRYRSQLSCLDCPVWKLTDLWKSTDFKSSEFDYNNNVVEVKYSTRKVIFSKTWWVL